MRTKITTYLGDELFEILNTAGIHTPRGFLRQGGIVEVKQFFRGEWDETLEDTVTDTSGTDSSNNLALKVECITSNL